MKKLLLTAFAFSMAICVNAQNRPAPLSTVLDRLHRLGPQVPVPYQASISGNEMPVNIINGTVINQSAPQHRTSMVQTSLGTSTYDLQTNGSVQNRIYNVGGTKAATWTFSTDVAGTYPDRGTAYVYNDGTAWSPAPTARIETDRRGWPNITRLANGNDVVVTHQSVTTATSTNTSVAGSNTWTQAACPNFPGGEPTLWVRTAAGGPDGNSIHMIDVSYPTGNGGIVVNGLDGCLNYSRSLDGGSTWDIVRSIPPGVSDLEYDGFRADGYAIDAKDNTIAFVSGDISDDWALWKSTDNGTTWTRTVILDFPFTKYDDATQITDVDGDGVADTVLTTDGSYAIMIDNNGMIHAFAGAMLILDDDPAALLGLFLSTDGLFYWNESMGTNPPVVVAQAPDLDGTGQAENFAAGFAGRYGNDGICSMPSCGVDAAGNLYLSYCPLLEGTDSGTPNNFSYRNVYLQASSDGGVTWNTPVNVSNDPFFESVFCSMAKNVDNGCVSLLWQQDDAPGYSVPPNGQHPINVNDFIYDCVDITTLLGVQETLTPEVAVSVYPNPAHSTVMLNYTVEKAVDLKIEIRNVMGQIIDTFIEQTQPSGVHTVKVDVENYSNGVYTVNTIMGNDVFSTKFVKN